MTIPLLTDYIWYEPGRVDAAFCEEVVARAEEFSDFSPGTIMSGEVANTIRDVNLTNIKRWPDLDAKFFQIYGAAINDYCHKHTDLQIQRDEGYLLLRYHKTQSYAQHVDSGTYIPRAVTAIIGLNEEYEGGEFWLWDGAWRQRIEKGALLMFPASFQYPHGIRPIESGVRYSVITWFL
jgi:hypothetical protein